MFLMPVLLSAITFTPAMAPHTAGTVEGTIVAPAAAPDASCSPGGICASAKLPVNRNGCYANNFYNGTNGGTPLSVELTQTGPDGSVVYIYWVNATNKTLTIKGSGAVAKWYCP
jgi:hypothetical protein